MREREFEKYLVEKYLNTKKWKKSTLSTTMTDARAADKRVEGGLDSYFSEDINRKLPEILYDRTKNPSADSHRGAANRYREFLRESEGLNIEDRGDEQDNAVSDTIRFSIEADLQNSLRQNLGQLVPGLTVADNGLERTVATGRIDILARDSNGVYWVIELKAGTANEQAVGQLTAYMSAFAEEEDIDIGNIHGVLIARDFNDKARYSARMFPSISLKSYGFKFSFEDVS